jgi:hypothetical protein
MPGNSQPEVAHSQQAQRFAFSPGVPKPRGINGTDWIRIAPATYDACLDTRDYRPKPKT